MSVTSSAVPAVAVHLTFDGAPAEYLYEVKSAVELPAPPTTAVHAPVENEAGFFEQPMSLYIVNVPAHVAVTLQPHAEQLKVALVPTTCCTLSGPAGQATWPGVVQLMHAS